MLKANKQINFISETPMAHPTIQTHIWTCVFGESEFEMKSMSVQYEWAGIEEKRIEAKRRAKWNQC